MRALEKLQPVKGMIMRFARLSILQRTLSDDSSRFKQTAST